MSGLHYSQILPVRIIKAFVKSLYHSVLKLRWTPSSRTWLKSLDKRIREKIVHQNYGKFVDVSYGSDVHSIWTVTVKGAGNGTVPIVILHGMGGGSNMFLNNINYLARKRDVILIDMPGFALSSRPQLQVKREGFWNVDTTAEDIEEFYTEVLNLWFEKMGLEKVVLLGHSYGGYICSVYCLKYPDRIKHLILADPWGFPPVPDDIEERLAQRSKTLVLLSKLLSKMNMFTPLRILGPFGQFVFSFIRADLRHKFNTFFTDNTFSDYLFACNTCDSPSGEIGFSRLCVKFGWSKKPLLERISSWAADLDVTFIFGAKSWIDSSSGMKAKQLRPQSFVGIQVIPEAGHHVYADQPEVFNFVVQAICTAVDAGHKPDHIDESELHNLICDSDRDSDVDTVQHSTTGSKESDLAENLKQRGSEGQVAAGEVQFSHSLVQRGAQDELASSVDADHEIEVIRCRKKSPATTKQE